MGHPRADLSRRGRAILWCESHPVRSRVVIIVGGLAYLWAAVGLAVGGL